MPKSPAEGSRGGFGAGYGLGRNLKLARLL